VAIADAKEQASGKSEAVAEPASESAPEADAKEPAESKEVDGAKPADVEAGDDDADDDREPSEVDRDRDTARLEALAKRLGMKVEGDRVSVNERAAFRDERRKTKQALQAEREAIEADRAKFQKDNESAVALHKRLADAIEAADIEEIAQAVGFKSWAELNQDFIQKRSSPLARELAAMKKRERERDEKDVKEAETRKQAERSAALERERKEYFARVSEDIDDSDDDSVRELGKIEGFREMVLRAENDALEPDGKGGYLTIPRDKAISVARQQAFESWQRLNAVFGKDAPPPEKARKAPLERPSARSSGGKTVTIDQIDTTTASGNQDWFAEAERALREAAASR